MPKGMFGGFAIGFASGNFGIESEDEKDGPGDAFEAHLGYAFDNQFGLGLGVSVNRYVYELSLLNQMNQKTEMALNFSAIDFSGYYFIELSPTWELGLRGGLSKVTASLELGSVQFKDKESEGIHLGVDFDWRFGDSATLMIQAYHRTYGRKDEEGASGMLVGVRWR